MKSLRDGIRCKPMSAKLALVDKRKLGEALCAITYLESDLASTVNYRQLSSEQDDVILIPT